MEQLGGLCLSCGLNLLLLPLFRHVSDWMFRGQLPPSKSGSEFYIVMKAGENPYRDRRFWSKQFITSARECEIPAFLSESWKVVFETGKAVNFLKQIQSEVGVV